MVLNLATGLGGNALDYGAGWGDLTARLAPAFNEIIGVDVDADRVAFARSEYAPIAFVQCAAEGLDMGDRTLDTIFSTVVLHFVPSPERYLSECRRVLRPGGHFVVTIQNPDSMWMTLRRLRHGARTVGWETNGGTGIKTWSGTRPSFRHWLAEHGFAIEREAGFYDPAFDRLRTPGDLILSGLNATGHLLSITGRWSYVGFRCRRDA